MLLIHIDCMHIYNGKHFYRLRLRYKDKVASVNAIYLRDNYCSGRITIWICLVNVANGAGMDPAMVGHPFLLS